MLIRTTSPDRLERSDSATPCETRRARPDGAHSGQSGDRRHGSARAAAARCRLRTRFGVTPPAPLSALKPGETAISDPVLIATTDVRTAPTRRSAQMLGSTACAAQKVGVYWETYGYAPGDSVDVAVIITRTSS